MNQYTRYLAECNEQELHEKLKWKRSDKGKWRERRNLYTIVRVEGGWELKDESGKKVGWGETLPQAQQEALSHWFSSGSATSSAIYNRRLKAAQEISQKLKESKEKMNEGLSTEARELHIYIENDRDLYRQQHTPIKKNLMAKRARGQYDILKAEKLFMYLVVAGAKKYTKQFGSPATPWNQIFSIPVRKEVARALRKDFEEEANNGDLDEYIPKKYRKKK